MKYLLPFAFLVLLVSPAQAKTYHLYYLGGQSNMDGYGFEKDLPEGLKQPLTGVRIFHGNPAPDGQPVDGRGLWSELRSGHGVGFKSEGKTNQYSDRFGVELTLAAELKKLYPDRNIALIKYSRGGTSIDIAAARNFGCWDPDFQAGEGEGKGVNQYDHFLATIRYASAVPDIDGDGKADVLIPAAIFWMQGESDAALDAATAGRYQANLKRLMDLIRAALRADDLPVVLGQISDSGRDDKDQKVWDWGPEVRQAQAQFVKNDQSAALVLSTDNYAYSDPWHYDSAGYLDLGKQFAVALSQLQAP